MSTEQAAIECSRKKCFSWRDARDEYTLVSNRGTSKVWACVKLVGEVGTKSFQLCCPEVDAHCCGLNGSWKRRCAQGRGAHEQVADFSIIHRACIVPTDFVADLK